MPLLPRITAWLIPILLLAVATHSPPSAPIPAPEAPHVTTALLGTSDSPFFDLGAAEEAERIRLEDERVELERLAAEEARQEAERAARVPPPVVWSQPPASSRISSGCGYEQLIRQTWPTHEGDRAVAVAMRESGCTNTARNPSGASGIFQTMLPMHQGLYDNVCADMALPGRPLAGIPHNEWWVNAECNVAVAFVLWQGSGWRPWGY